MNKLKSHFDRRLVTKKWLKCVTKMYFNNNNSEYSDVWRRGDTMKWPCIDMSQRLKCVIFTSKCANNFAKWIKNSMEMSLILAIYQEIKFRSATSQSKNVSMKPTTEILANSKQFYTHIQQQQKNNLGIWVNNELEKMHNFKKIIRLNH